jgi:hypothetical protein
MNKNHLGPLISSPVAFQKPGLGILHSIQTPFSVWRPGDSAALGLQSPRLSPKKVKEKAALMEPSSADVNRHAPLRLLSLDGGGVRGLSSLMVLDDLMESIALEEKRLGRRPRNDIEQLKPCDYFDL